MKLEFLELARSEDSYWNSKVAFFRAQQSAGSSLPNAEQLIRSFEPGFKNSAWHASPPVSINASRLSESGVAVQRIGITTSEAQQCFKSGFSLCFGDLSHQIENVGLLRNAAAEILGYPDTILVTAYLSPPTSVGILHYDTQHNFFIQREGTKRWFVSDRAAVNNPHRNFIYNGAPASFFNEMAEQGLKISLPGECGRTEYILHPGDVLYVPPGFYHSPETLDEHSLHYTLTVEPACFWFDFQRHIFAKLLKSGGNLYRDCRFDEEAEKHRHFDSCIKYIIEDFKKS